MLRTRNVSRLPRRVPLLLALAAFACAPADDEVSADASDALTPPAVEAAVVALGSEAAQELASSLIGRLQTVLAEEGAAGAVAFCSAEGLPLTADVSREVGFDIKRTSSRIRNPANAPDLLERVALDHFEQIQASGDSLPARFVQRLPGGEGFRYYQPLRVQPFCVQCHGASEELADGVATVLAEHYPEDEATGYSAGDFRGLIRVTVPASAVDTTGP
ncbi:MAG: Tll0287-like domain-containing protein [Gemmatimonadota bacterium]